MQRNRTECRHQNRLLPVVAADKIALVRPRRIPTSYRLQCLHSTHCGRKPQLVRAMIMQITPAADENLDEINALMARSKAYWDWSPEYLDAALRLMVLCSHYLRENLCFEVREDGELVGFLSVKDDPQGPVLDNLWVDPRRIGQGLGRRACEFLFRLALRKRWPALYVVPDPPAEGFYSRMGFVDTGAREASRVPGGPVFSVFKIEFRLLEAT